MNSHEKLQYFRELSGKTQEIVARAAGINTNHYYDLETFPGDLDCSVSLKELAALASELNFSVPSLFSEQIRDDPSRISADMVVDKFAKRMKSLGITSSELDNLAGYEVSTIFENPIEVWNWNVNCLRQVCAVLQIDWIDMFPGK